MANKKVKPSEDYYDFLPEAVQNSTKIKTISEKNVLATLCFQYLSHSEYASEHNGWFYCTLKEIMEGAGIEFAQVKRIMTKLEIQKLIERKPGTTHHPSHYKLHPKIVELLPVIESNSDNEPQLGVINTNEPQLCIINNEPHIENSSVEIPNEPQDKIRQVKTSQDKTSLNVTNNTVDVVSKAAFEDAASQQQDLKEIFKKWRIDVDNAKTVEELEQKRDEFLGVVRAMGGMTKEMKTVFEPYKDHYDCRYALLRH